jgi:DNA repair exonuclease SbcCD ATPase subunit
MCANALIDAQVYRQKLLKGFGYPNETFARAQDYRALDIVLKSLVALREQHEEVSERLDCALGVHVKLIRQLGECETDRRALSEQRVQLEQYLTHHEDCARSRWMQSIAILFKPHPACSCGLDAALASTPTPGEE